MAVLMHKPIEQILEAAKVADVITVPSQVITVPADATISEVIKVRVRIRKI
jgi:CBS domain-containing protein